LEKIQESLGGVGKIYKHGPFSIQLRVYLMEELKILINYFDKYPLITQKYADYQLFKQAFLLIDNKEHLTEEGLQKLVAIRASMNLGNSVALKAAFLPSSPAPLLLLAQQRTAKQGGVCCAAVHWLPPPPYGCGAGQQWGEGADIIPVTRPRHGWKIS
jgi:hypothetical protein